MSRVRCAIYTRKSSEEGLEQDFNSLDAQHESCAAYIKSQTSEGWQLVRDRYDDGGISGGTLQRPGLQRLLADINAGHIDIVVVYKVDRLTRSLLDFSKLVEAFDKARVSFVSVTQSFNTTSSMGRLTLNMLLSFAQFEREVTAERIRDKIAQSKARGMWMGGTPPIGYRPDGRSLAIVEEHAAIVRHIFSRYAELRNVRLLADELNERGINCPERATAGGRRFGGGAFTRGQLYKLLRNPTYIGRIDHGGRSHKANHPPIIEQAQWDEAQAVLAANRNGIRGPAPAEPSLLAGMLVDERGMKMVAVHACKGKMRYRYYVSRDLQHSGNARASDGWRLPAREIEPLVRARVAALLNDPIDVLASQAAMPSPAEFKRMIERGKAAAVRLAAPRAPGAKLLRDLVSEVRLGSDRVIIFLNPAKVTSLLGIAGLAETIELEVVTSLKRSGCVMRLITQNGSAAVPTVDTTLIKSIARARNWWDQLCEDDVLTVTAIADREKLTRSYVTRVLRLAFLSPNVLKSLLDGKGPAHLTTDRLTVTDAVPGRWEDQRKIFCIV
jgi:DNA invertase Pin-like site-specific DNA recombinase